MTFVADLTWRGLVYQASDPALAEKLREPTVLYAGFDPTADSLHIGSLLPILALKRAQLAGHKPIALVGGATGMIGDPSGKSEERKLLSFDDVARNAQGIRRQLERFLDFGAGCALLVNNAEWFTGVSYLEFLRDVGKYFSVNAMLNKDSVRSRLEDREHGISYTEFSYMLVQAFDFLWLHEHYGCRLQLGGSDQWGNMTAGIDLIRRLRQTEAYALTLPLITTASGQKFGKTEKGAIWLDPKRTSPYEFYQYFMQTDDRDVGRFLRFYTFLAEKEISALEETLRLAPEKREAHRVLAREVTTLVHGKDEARLAEESAKALFSGARELSAASIATAFAGAPSSALDQCIIAGDGLPLLQVLCSPDVALAGSLGAARRDIAGGGVYVNEERVTDVGRKLTSSDVIEGKYVLLRKGKKTYHVLCVVKG